MNLDEWKEKNKYSKSYAHFDDRVSLDEVWSYIIDSNNIKKHSFYPFIHYSKELTKFKNGTEIPKKRSICYSAHVDRYIYSYYGYILNEIYNKRVIKEGINNTAIAYRNNLKKNNIDFSKEAIDFIRKAESCYIMIGDFTNFFDNLDHVYLKERLCDLLEVKRLPDDFYAVYKNITKYSTWELKDILSYYKLPNNNFGIRQLNMKKRIFNIREYRELKRQSINNAKKNPNSYGIPQGSAISAVLSNIYMLDCDKKIKNLADKYNGLYMRYSDDIILIIPKVDYNNFKVIYDEIIDLFSSIYVSLQSEKTQFYTYDNKKLLNCNNCFNNLPNGKNQLSYLGFTFDGQNVTIRPKTISKYYYRMYRKISTIVKCGGMSKKGKRISAENLYIKYSVKGSKSSKCKGNFLTYVDRANRIWEGKELITRDTKRHLVKIRKGLDKIKSNNK